MRPPPPNPLLPHNPSRDLALQELPDDANVQIFMANTKEKQMVPELRTGTGTKGRVDFGDQIGARRLRVGDCLLVIAAITRNVKGVDQVEAWIATEIMGRPVELLVPAQFTMPITEFRRA